MDILKNVIIFFLGMFLIVSIVEKIDISENLKKFIMIIVSCIYNFTIGFFGMTIFFSLFIFLNMINSNLIKYFVFIIILINLILPINDFIRRKGRLSEIIYPFLVIIFLVLGFIGYKIT